MTVACLKGKWSPKKKRCRIGMRGVSVLTPKARARNPGFEDIRPGDRVTIVTHHGSKLTGRVVMRSGDGRGWVLNLGGKHGTPGLAYPKNTIKVSKSKTGPTYLNPRRLKMKSKRHKHKRRKKSNPELLIVNNPRHAKHKRRKRRSKKSARKILYRRKRRSLGQLVKLVGKRKAKKIWGGKKSRAHGKRKRKSSRRGRRSS
jgi:hypothetical protein